MLEIDPKIHAQLLYYLNELPYDEAIELRKELQATYAAYIAEVANYEIIERTIRSKVATKKLDITLRSSVNS
jgi:hypothetical protein